MSLSLAERGIRFGAFTPILAGGDVLEAINLWEQRLNRRLDLVNSFRKWGGDSGNINLAIKSLQQMASGGRSPMISWEPLHWDGTPGPYTLNRIVAGDHDVYLRQWAMGLRKLGFIVYMRPMHEMNGNWYHWSGNPHLYIQAWRHIVDIFDAEGAGNVKWVWCVNAADVPADNDLENYWPGESYVDILGIDGYNCYGGWRTFAQINRPAYNRVCALTAERPVWICETASAEASPDIAGAITATVRHTKAEWLRGLFATSGMDRLEALLWFNERNPKTFDWRIDSSMEAMYELRRQLAAMHGHVLPPAPYVPPVPDRVTVAVDGPGAVRISWRPVSSFTRGYKVLRRTTSFSVVQTVSKSVTSVRLTGLEPGLTYSFAVQSYTLVRNSAASTVVPVYVGE